MGAWKGKRAAEAARADAADAANATLQAELDSARLQLEVRTNIPCSICNENAPDLAITEAPMRSRTIKRRLLACAAMVCSTTSGGFTLCFTTTNPANWDGQSFLAVIALQTMVPAVEAREAKHAAEARDAVEAAQSAAQVCVDLRSRLCSLQSFEECKIKASWHVQRRCRQPALPRKTINVAPLDTDTNLGHKPHRICKKPLLPCH